MLNESKEQNPGTSDPALKVADDSDKQLLSEMQLSASSVQSMVTQGKGKKKYYACPYQGCEKKFKESGNLKTHIRIHVSKWINFILYAYERIIRNRLESGRIFASTMPVERASLPRAT